MADKTTSEPFKASRPPNQQQGSSLMQIPQEIRDMIYSYVFCSTRISCGDKTFSSIVKLRMTPVPNALALLRTCLRAHVEIGPRWLSEILFSFETPTAMLNKLTSIPTKTMSMIRRVRVSGDSLSMLCREEEIYYRTSALLRLLPGLQLDRLTVMGTKATAVSYETLNKLIRLGEGWKELHYISHSSALLGFQDMWAPWDGDLDRDLYLRMPQPSTWQQALEDRDGSDSCPSVAVYRATNPGRCSVLLHAATRAPFAQTLSEGQTISSFHKTEDASLMAPGEREKEMLVVVKRGRDCDYKVKESPKYPLDDDMRYEIPVAPWKEIARGGNDVERDGGLLPDFLPKTILLLKDGYSHVDDYVWTPLYYERDLSDL